MTVVVICPDCAQEAEYVNGSSEVFTVRLRCVEGCQPVPEEDLEDPSALEHLGSVRQEGAGQRS